MNRIQKIFRQRDRKIIPFLTAGFPKISHTVDLVLQAEASGAALVEIGMPFSDPLADGPVIQKASQIALEQGVNLKTVLSMVHEIRKSSQIPLVLMGYINPIIQYGLKEFLVDAKEAGVDGFILPDLPPEEGEEYISLCRDLELASILIIAPNCSNERIQYLSGISSTLLYCTSILGVTGSSMNHSDSLRMYLNRVRENSSTPFVVGFGIRNKEDVNRVSELADGAVIGSELLRRLEHAQNPVESMAQLFEELN